MLNSNQWNLIPLCIIKKKITNTPTKTSWWKATDFALSHLYPKMSMSLMQMKVGWNWGNFVVFVATQSFWYKISLVLHSLNKMFITFICILIVEFRTMVGGLNARVMMIIAAAVVCCCWWSCLFSHVKKDFVEQQQENCCWLLLISGCCLLEQQKSNQQQSKLICAHGYLYRMMAINMGLV